MKRWMVGLLTAIVLLVTLSATVLAQDNILVNGDFEQSEDGGIPGWTEGSYSKFGLSVGIDGVDAVSGSSALKIECGQPNDVYMMQTFVTKPNYYYRISGWIKAEGLNAKITGAWLNITGTDFGSKPIHDTQGEWQYVEFIGRAGMSQTQATIAARVGNHNNTNTGTAWFDLLRVEEISRPAQGTAALNLYKDGGLNITNSPDALWGFMLVLTVVFILCAVIFYRERLTARSVPEGRKHTFLWIMAAAALLRIVLAYVNYGYHVDITCFSLWSDHMAAAGPWGFYADGYFCDYPPGYMYVLWFVGGIRNLLGLAPMDTGLSLMIVKLPAIIADLGSAYLVYRIARDKWQRTTAIVIASLLLFNPAVIFNSAVWSQIDSIMTLLLILMVDQIIKRKLYTASVWLVVAALVKPQALMFGMLLLYPLLRDVFTRDKAQMLRGLKQFFGCLGLGLGLGTLLVLPFFWQMPIPWELNGWPEPLARWANLYVCTFQKFLGTMTSYPYASLNAANLFSLFGGNWATQDSRFLFGTYQTIGMLAIPITIGLSAWLFDWRKKGFDDTRLFFIGAISVMTMYMLGVRMHERYLYPAMALLLLGFVHTKDRRLLLGFMGVSVIQCLLVTQTMIQTHIPQQDPWLIWLSVGGLAFFGFLVYVGITAYRRGRIDSILDHLHDTAAVPHHGRQPALDRALSVTPKERWTRWDTLLILGLTLVYAAIALPRLGSMSAPESYWQPKQNFEQHTLDFGGQTQVSQIWRYAGIGAGSVELFASEDGVIWSQVTTITHVDGDMYKWIIDETSFTGRYVRVDVLNRGIMFNELAFVDSQGNTIPVQLPEEAYVSQDPNGTVFANLFNEQDTRPDRPSFYNSMYFDEIYHARTGYEHLHQIEPYETTHPPLGKVIISFGISIFGMNPFGWRIMGALMGILMVPAMYGFGKSLFGKSKYAFLMAFLMTFDFMHVAQTRIATIDSYAVLFIILMYWMMYLYYKSNSLRDGLRKSLWPLALSGVFFGLGAASKWICLYSGAGLAVIFACVQVWRFKEYRQAKLALYKHEGGIDTPVLEYMVRRYWWHTGITLLWCLIFFIIVPVVIYVASYIPFMMVPGTGHGLKEVWSYQQHMFKYHADLIDNHPYASGWWTWPLMIRPIWFYMGQYLKEGWVESISSFGNPAVWWAGCAALIWGAVTLYKRFGQQRRDMAFILIGFLSQFLPWVLVPRTMFIYHYFASIPFIIMMTVVFFKHRIAIKPNWNRIMYGFMGVTLVLFALFFPLITALPIPLWYAHLCRWLPSWVLFAG